MVEVDVEVEAEAEVKVKVKVKFKVEVEFYVVSRLRNPFQKETHYKQKGYSLIAVVLAIVLALAMLTIIVVVLTKEEGSVSRNIGHIFETIKEQISNFLGTSKIFKTDEGVVGERMMRILPLDRSYPQCG